MITNLKKHALVGFAVGLLGALLVLNLCPWMGRTPGQPITPPMARTAILGSLVFAGLTVLWELGQQLAAMFSSSRRFPRVKDTIADLIVGNLAFNLPWLVITLGTYAGNVLRP